MTQEGSDEIYNYTLKIAGGAFQMKVPASPYVFEMWGVEPEGAEVRAQVGDRELSNPDRVYAGDLITFSNVGNIPSTNVSFALTPEEEV